MKYDKDVDAFVGLDRQKRKTVIALMFDHWDELKRRNPEKARLFGLGVLALDALHHEGKVRTDGY